MKLSKAQQDVVDKMRAVWRLHQSTSITSDYRWLSDPDGPRFDKVNGNTFNSLRRAGVIECPKRGFPSQEWFLAEGGDS